MPKAGDLLVRIEASSEGLRREFAKADAAMARSNGFVSQYQKSLEAMEARALSFGKATAGSLAALTGGLSLGAAVNQIYGVNAEFQKLAASLKTVTGSTEGAKAAMATVETFAKETPYKLSEVTEAFIKLKALGLDASIDSLRSYGNTASALGKPINQMIEAVSDAATGELERLKEFGIKASSEGDKVRFTFQGVTTTVGKNAMEIERYLQRLGEVQFAGAMEEQMKTLGGQASNLADQFDALMRAIGDAGANDAMSAALIAATAVMAELAKQTKMAGEGFKDWDTRSMERLQHDANIARERVGELRKELEGIESRKRSIVGGWFSGFLDDKAAKIKGQIMAEENVAAYSAVRIAQMDPSISTSVLRPEARPKGDVTSAEAAKKAAQHAEAIAKQIVQLKFQQDQLSRTEREQAIYSALQQNSLSITSEHGRQVAELAGRLYDEAEARKNATSTAEELLADIKKESDERAKGAKALDDYVSGLERENRLLAMSPELREQSEAMIEAENIARQHGIELTDQQRARIAELTTAKQGLIAEEQQHKAALQELENFGERAFDRIGTSMTEMAMQGQDAWLSMRNLGLAVISELMQEMFKLAAVNPLKNAIFGGNAVTMSGVGGLLGKLFGSGASTTTPTEFAPYGSMLPDVPTAATGGFVTGGGIARYGAGGKISGPGTGTSDDIMAAVRGGGMIRVSNGESINTAEATKKYWPLIDAMNNGRLPAFADGGIVGRASVPALSPANLNGGSRAGGDQYYIDARGADREGLARLEAMIRATNASVERRAVAAVNDRSGRTLKKR